MEDNLKYLIGQGYASRDNTVRALSKKYLQKAKSNLVTMRLLSEINVDKKAREFLSIPADYNSDEWVVVTGYYAMYSGALALLAKIGFKSKNHSATLQILEEYFVKKKILAQESLLLLKNAGFQKEELEKISDARHKREIAQYSVTKQTTKDIAEKIKKDAYDFINKVEAILE
jgi:uncharacterized protein (UPF0332 family)